MDWPPQSPDLNPIEQMWEHLDCLLRQSPQTSAQATWLFLEKTWSEIAPAVLEVYIDSMERRCKAVIAAKRGHTKY